MGEEGGGEPGEGGGGGGLFVGAGEGTHLVSNDGGVLGWIDDGLYILRKFTTGGNGDLSLTLLLSCRVVEMLS